MVSFWVSGQRAKTRPQGGGNPSECAETICVGRIGKLSLKGRPELQYYIPNGDRSWQGDPKKISSNLGREQQVLFALELKYLLICPL